MPVTNRKEPRNIAGEPLLSQKWFPRTPSENQLWMEHGLFTHR